ncbi:MAG: flavin reductase family protein [Propionibacteriaceae bacterium]|nr:flavin reductase family protein [Propionibacteriaceae bacterium]
MTGTITAQDFRETLGHYPTGVALVTAVVDGQPLGMVVGSFTSVSLDPPLVAYLPMKTSGTYAQLQTADSFCINVLAADQLQTCRHFASRGEDKFASVSWHPSPSGAPILDDAVSWIDCTLENTFDGGDHDIVVGRVGALGVQRPVLPLLFFQGGYGQFDPLSLVAVSGSDLVVGARLSEMVRASLEELAAEEKVDIAVLAKSGNFGVFVATINESTQPGRTSVGMRLPLVPPTGIIFHVDNQANEDAWINLIPKVSDEARAEFQRLAKKVRDRGYSISLRSSGMDEEVWNAAQRLAEGTLTPSEERILTQKLATTGADYEPDIEADEPYDLRAITVAVPHGPDQVPLALRLSTPPGPTSGATVLRWAERLKSVAAQLGAELSNKSVR